MPHCFSKSLSRLEQESGFFFNMKYVEDEVHNGNWDEVEKYLSGFTKVDDNRYSMKIFFEIRNQKYLEALDKNDRPNVVDIVGKDLKVFSTFNKELFKEITQLLTLKNFRPSFSHKKTLFVDHSCGPPNGARAPSPVRNPLLDGLPKAGGYPPLGVHGNNSQAVEEEKNAPELSKIDV
ncbi:unnamed protein product [Brassica oleracea]